MAIEKLVQSAVAAVSDAVNHVDPSVSDLRPDLRAQAEASLAAIDHGTFDHPWLTVADDRTIAFSPTAANGQPLLVNGKRRRSSRRPILRGR